MKKRIFKKILLGSLLTSAVTVATVAFTTDVLSNNSTHNVKNTSSYKNIYSQSKNNIEHTSPNHTPIPFKYLSSTTPIVPLPASPHPNPSPLKMTPYASVAAPVKFHLYSMRQPSSSTAKDGQAIIWIEGWDPSKMTFASNSALENPIGTWYPYTYVPHKYMISVNGMADSWKAQIGVALTNGATWTDGSKVALFSKQYRFFYNANQIDKTTFVRTIQEPSTHTASDGVATFTMEHFNPAFMQVKLAPGSNGTLGTYDPATKQIKVTGLALGQQAKIYVYPKDSTESIPSTMTGFGVDDDNNSDSKMYPTTSSILTQSNATTNQTTYLQIDFALKSWKSSDVTPTFANIMKKATFTKNIHTSFQFNITSHKWLHKGSEVVGESNAATFTLDSQTSSGNASQIKLLLWMDANIQNAKLKSKLTLSVNGYGEDNGAVSDIKTIPFNLKSSWKNGAREHLNSPIATVGLKKPTFTKAVKQPTTSTSTDGEVTFTIADFQPSYMELSLAPGSNGILGTYDSAAKKVKVTNIAVGQHAQIQVTLKPNNFWSNKITTPQKSSVFTPAQTYVGLTKTTFTKVVKEPTTTTSTDGEVTYTLTNFDETKMTLSLVAGSGGTLGTYDPQTRKVKVTGLANGQYGQIMVSLKQSPAASITKSMIIRGIDEDDTTNNANMSKTYAWVNDTWTLDTTSTISFDFIAKSWKTPTKKPSYKDIIKNGQYSKHFKGDMVFDKATQKWTYNGKNAQDYKITDSIFYLWSKDSKNNPSQNQIRVWVDYNISTKQLTFNYDLSFTDTAGENNLAVTQFNVKTHKQISFWKDGTALSRHSSKFTPAQTYVGLTKTTFTKVVKQPTTTTSTDGEVTFTLIDFDETKMTLSLVAGSSGTLGQFNLRTNKVKVINFASGQHTQIQVVPKTRETWKDGTQVPQLSSDVTLAQTYVGLTKITFTNTVTQPKTTTSTDGEVIFTLTNFDPANMILSIASGASGSLGSFDAHTNTIKVTNLSSGQHAQIQVTLKPYSFWTDGTSVVINSPSVNLTQTVVGLTKITFTNTVTQPKTTASTDGEATYTLTNFDKTKMDISLVAGSSGTLGTYNAGNRTIKVTGLVHKQHAQIQVTLKTNNIWADGTTSIIKSPIVNISQTNTGLIKTTFTNTVTKPKTTTSTDGEVTFTMIYYNPARMDVSLASGSGGTIGTFDSNNNKIKVTGLASGQHAQIQVTLKQNQIWTDGTSVVIHSLSVNLTQTVVGLTKTTFTNTVTQPKTTTSTDGEATFTLTNFDETKMDISLATGANGDLGSFDAQTNTIKVTHLSNGQKTKIQVTLKINNIWADGTSLVLNSPLISINQSSIGLTKTIFAKTVRQPTTTTSTDGEATFTLTHFDKTKMDISLAPGSNGVLGVYDPQTRQIQVTGVAVRGHAQIQVTLKTNNIWADGTTTPQTSSTFKPAQTFVGITKTTFTNTVTQPKTTTSTDGEVIFTLTNFDPAKMIVSITPKSNGNIGIFDTKTKTIKIKDLSNGQHAQIQVSFKSSDIWVDGSTSPVKSSLVNLVQQQSGIAKPVIKHKLTQPTTTTSTDGEVIFTLTHFSSSKMDISLATDSNGTLGALDSNTNTIKVTNLKHGQFVQIQFTLKQSLIWADGTTAPSKSFKIKIQHNDSWLDKVEITSVISTPTTATAKDGVVTFKLKNFHPTKMSVDFSKKSDGSIGAYDPEKDTLEVVGLSIGQHVQVEVSLKGNQSWADGTVEPIKSKKIKIIKSGIKLVKIVKKEFTQPSGATTGTITLTLEKYDSDNIEAKIIGAHGVIGAYNAQTKEIKVTRLSQNEKAEIEFSLKPNNNATGSKNWWENGTDEPQQKVFYMGYNKISLDNIELLVPTKSSSNDGQITFNIPGFNPATMEVKLLKGSSGVLGKFDPKNNKIKVSELKIGESAKIKIFLKDKTIMWSDGSKKSLESTNVKIPSPYVTDNSSSGLTKEGKSNLLLIGIIVGVIIVINIGWIGMYKLMKSRRDDF